MGTATRRATARLLASTAIIHAMPVAPARAAPEHGTLVACAASIARPASLTTDIRQSSARAVIDWGSFDVGITERVRFDQPVGGAALNRVTGGGGASLIDGTITANGTVIVQNTAGVVFGKDARVDVGSLIATVRSVEATGFMARRFDFGGGGGFVVNAGRLTIAATRRRSGAAGLRGCAR